MSRVACINNQAGESPKVSVPVKAVGVFRYALDRDILGSGRWTD